LTLAYGIPAGGVKPPDICSDNQLKIASPIDLMATKILAIDNRTEEKDYRDVAEMIRQGIPLQKGFEAAQAIYNLSSSAASQFLLKNVRDRLFLDGEQIIPGESGSVLRSAAESLDLEKIFNARRRMKAHSCIEREITQRRKR
jgi:hypothetical protein